MLMRLSRIAPLLFLLAGCVSAERLRLDPAHAYRPAETCTSSTFDATWRDDQRARDVPVRVYLPGCAGRHPVVLFSHGIANSREGYGFLGQAWARAGYVAVHLTHQGSDRAVLDEKGPLALYRAAKDRRHWIDRSKDIHFVLNYLERVRGGSIGDSGLVDRVDAARTGVAGHSYGSFTALTTAGFLIGGSDPPLDFSDARVKAIVALSTPKLEAGGVERAYQNVHLPVLHMTGSRDWSILFRTRVSDRSTPFRMIPFSPQQLVVLTDAGHSSFSDDERRPSINRAIHIEAMQQITTAWWDAKLRGDARAEEWLREGARTLLGTSGTIERK